jgi:hypothetical protein
MVDPFRFGSQVIVEMGLLGVSVAGREDAILDRT